MSVAGARPQELTEPPGVTVVGWILSLSVLGWVPIIAAYRLKHADGNTIMEVS